MTARHPRRATEALLVLCAALLGAVLSTWPLATAPLTHLLGNPGAEVSDHLWALWIGLEQGPLVADTTLLDFPRGSRWVVADPANLLFFAPGMLLGPVAAFAAVQFCNQVLAGLAAAALWRAFLGGSTAGAAFAALAGATLPVLAGGLFSGMSEAQTMGWIGLMAAALWRGLGRGGAAVVLSGLALGVCAWAGPYTGLYGAITAVVLTLAALGLGQPAPRRLVLRRATVSALLAAALAAPVARAVLIDRDADLPGNESLVEAVFAEPDVPKNKMLSGDLLGLAWPTATASLWPDGDPAAMSATQVSYQGLALLLLAVAGVAARRRDAGARALLAAFAVMVVLGLGYHLQIRGDVVRLGGHPLVLPAGWLSWRVPILGRAARWYRAHIAAGVLLVPLAVAGAEALTSALRRPRGRFAAWAVLAALVVMDALGSGSLPWPRPLFDGRPPTGLLTLAGRGPLLELPAPRGGGSAERLRNPALLWQTWHGRAIGGNPLVARSSGMDPAVAALDRVLTDAAVREDPVAARQATQQAAALGFEWIVHVPSSARVSVPRESLILALGEPDAETAQLLAWKLPG